MVDASGCGNYDKSHCPQANSWTPAIHIPGAVAIKRHRIEKSGILGEDLPLLFPHHRGVEVHQRGDVVCCCRIGAPSLRKGTLRLARRE
jgi:hypothetical protein